MENINRIIRERRSIFPKEFNGNKLEDSILETLLENANYAPNHKSNYPWRFIVISDHALHRFLHEAAEIYKDDTPSEKFNQQKLDKIYRYEEQVSHCIAIVMERSDDTILNEDICAVAAAVQNIYLSLDTFPKAAGYWSTGLGTYSSRMRTFFGLNEYQTLMGYFILGEVDLKRTEGRRRNFRDFVSFLNS